MAATEFWLRPLDPLFFGPPQSFSAGEAHHASSAFPPSPWTLQGIVRTHLLKTATLDYRLADRGTAARQEREALVGPPDALPDGWRLAPPVPVVEVEDEDSYDPPYLDAWFPVPRFLFHPPDGRNGPPVRGVVLVDGISESSWDFADDRTASWVQRGEALVVGPPPGEGDSKPLRGWIDAGNLRWSLTGHGSWSSAGHHEDLPPFVKRERQVGVAIDDSLGTAHDQLLYTRQRLRFAEGSGLWSCLDIDSAHDRPSPDALRHGIAHAGNRVRPVELVRPPAKSDDWAAVERPHDLPAPLSGKAPDEKLRVWLYLASPACIAADQSRPQIHAGAGSGTDVRVRAAFVGPPEVHGGLSMASGASRGNQMLVPAGSVWLIELTGGEPAERKRVLEALHGGYPLANPHNPRERAHAAFGFGRTFVGIGPDPFPAAARQE